MGVRAQHGFPHLEDCVRYLEAAVLLFIGGNYRVGGRGGGKGSAVAMHGCCLEMLSWSPERVRRFQPTDGPQQRGGSGPLMRSSAP